MMVAMEPTIQTSNSRSAAKSNFSSMNHASTFIPPSPKMDRLNSMARTGVFFLAKNKITRTNSIQTIDKETICPIM